MGYIDTELDLDTGIATTDNDTAEQAYQDGELSEQERDDIQQINYIQNGRQ